MVAVLETPIILKGDLDLSLPVGLQIPKELETLSQSTSGLSEECRTITDFDGPNSLKNPQNWSVWRKRFGGSQLYSSVSQTSYITVEANTKVNLFYSFCVFIIGIYPR